MKKSLVWLVLALALSLSACGTAKAPERASPAGTGVTVLEGDAPEEQVAEKSDDDYMPVEECLPACVALGEGDALINRRMCEGSCWADEAKHKKDISICREKIEKDNSIPYIACFMNIAEATGDATACDGIADNKKDMMVMGCYTSVADKFSKPEICENIKGSLLYDSCVSDAQTPN